eukprot:1750642-Alexandrium_andersonii.AAC.1
MTARARNSRFHGRQMLDLCTYFDTPLTPDLKDAKTPYLSLDFHPAFCPEPFLDINAPRGGFYGAPMPE